MPAASAVVNEVMWTEKYRPTSLDQLALDPETRKLFDSYIAQGEVPHLLLVGPPGSGKTTIARILAAALDCRLLTLNASTDRGIDVVRSKIGSFVTSMIAARWNIVFLDESDSMTSDAQTGLRNLIEAHADRSRFILTANSGWKIIPAIQSRCQVITMGAPPLKERARVLLTVLEAEGIKADPMIALGYAERFPDMRRMLFSAQRAVQTHGSLPPAIDTVQASGGDIYQFVVQKNWAGLISLVTNADFDPQQALRDLFWAIPDEHPRCGYLRHMVGRAVHDSGYTPDPPVLFLATCSAAMED